MNYTQCTFRKGNAETRAWIPSTAAKVGNRVQLVSLDNELWDVISTGETVSKEFIKENERNYKEFQGSTNGGGID